MNIQHWIRKPKKRENELTKDAAERNMSDNITKKKREINRKRIEVNKEYRSHYIMHKNVWNHLQGDEDAYTKEMKKAEIQIFKNLHWNEHIYVKWNAALRKRREAYQRKKVQLQHYINKNIIFSHTSFGMVLAVDFSVTEETLFLFLVNLESFK